MEHEAKIVTEPTAPAAQDSATRDESVVVDPRTSPEVNIDLTELILRSTQQQFTFAAEHFTQVITKLGDTMERKLSAVADCIIQMPEGQIKGDRHTSRRPEDPPSGNRQGKGKQQDIQEPSASSSSEPVPKQNVSPTKQAH